MFGWVGVGQTTKNDGLPHGVRQRSLCGGRAQLIFLDGAKCPSDFRSLEITVIYTDTSQTERRIISAWKAERHEREAYWENCS
jgi:hypothetical protein